LASRNLPQPAGETNDEHTTSEIPHAEVFELGKLFEATMNGMREGLLVVDRDMRVVASEHLPRTVFSISLAANLKRNA
jgi:hypothetical protein